MSLDIGQKRPDAAHLTENEGPSGLSKNGRHKTSPPSRKPSDDSRKKSSEVSKKSSQRSPQPAKKPDRRHTPTVLKQTLATKGVYSAIDLGTNNCRLLIACPTPHGFRVIDAFSRVVRLGEGLSQSNLLTQGAMDRTVEALKICADKIAKRKVTCMRHVATEACRVANNSAEFIARVKAETGINLDIISPGEEARLAVMGCQSLIASGNRHALVFDIGGGSTELIWVRVCQAGGTEIVGWMSIPWGVVNLSEKFNISGDAKNQPLASGKYEQMVGSVKSHLHAFEAAHQVSATVNKRKTQFLGTSGTVTTLASLHLQLPRYMRDKVDGAWMKSKEIRNLSRSVAEMSYDQRVTLACIGQERADLVVAGCAILEAILSMWNVPSLRVADRGIREGILRGMMNIEKTPSSQNQRRNRSNRRRRRKPVNKGTANG